MDIKEIQERVEHIRKIKRDHEFAHMEEDALMRDFIFYISTLNIPISAKAKLIITTNDINFFRWCA